jgi:peroxiredoxin Q/BCP
MIFNCADFCCKAGPRKEAEAHEGSLGKHFVFLTALPGLAFQSIHAIDLKSITDPERRSLMLRIVLIVLVVIVGILVVPRLVSRTALPAVGTQAPQFTLSSQEGTPVSLIDYRGKWVVLYFYPKDQTPGCTREAHNFQADQSKYAERNAVILGVSVDSVDSHKKFCAKEGLNFKLLADTDHKVTSAYGSLTNLGVAKFAARHTFLIDPNGRIAKVYSSVDPAQHSAEVLAELDKMQKSDSTKR